MNKIRQSKICQREQASWDTCLTLQVGLAGEWATVEINCTLESEVNIIPILYCAQIQNYSLVSYFSRGFLASLKSSREMPSHSLNASKSATMGQLLELFSSNLGTIHSLPLVILLRNLQHRELRGHNAARSGAWDHRVF